VRVQRGVRPRLRAEHEERLQSAADDSWSRPLEALNALLAEEPWRMARTRVVFADHWARYAIVPWAAALSSREERLDHGRQILASIYGDAVASWEVRISEAPPQANQVACAVPAELIAALRAACTAHGGVLLSLQAQLVASYDAWRHCLPASNAWFVSIEQGSLATARLAGKGWDRVHVVRIGPDWTRELTRLQTFGRLASNTPAEGQVYVDAPHAWREVAAGVTGSANTGGLQWLEEPAGTLTTLQRLGRVRRMAA